jgi:hypothetical protein
VTERRGRIVLKDGQVRDVPSQLLDDEEISWPPTLPEKRPSEPVRYLSAKDFYRRHEIVEGQAFLYLPHGLDVSEVDPSIVEALTTGRRLKS